MKKKIIKKIKNLFKKQVATSRANVKSYKIGIKTPLILILSSAISLESLFMTNLQIAIGNGLIANTKKMISMQFYGSMKFKICFYRLSVQFRFTIHTSLLNEKSVYARKVE